MYQINKTYDLNYLIDRFNEKYKPTTDKHIIKRPNIQTGKLKIYIQNFKEVCASINRDPNDISTYIAKELQIQTSISANGSLIMHGNYRKNNIEKIIDKYIINFVKCPLCKGFNTNINKINKMIYLSCNKCLGSTSRSDL